MDEEGKIVNIYDYWADGNLRYISEEVEQPFLYTGAYYDRERGLYYLRARYYSPELRKFLQRDPILLEGGINLYAYTGCDFVNWGNWEGLHGAIGVAIGGVVVIGSGGFIGCVLICFGNVREYCEELCENCEMENFNREIAKLRCRNLAIEICFTYCLPILNAISCLSNKEMCALEYVIKFKNEFRKKLCE